MRDIGEVLAERPKTAVEFPNLDDKRSVSSRGSRSSTSRRVRSSRSKTRPSFDSEADHEGNTKFPSPHAKSSPSSAREEI